MSFVKSLIGTTVLIRGRNSGVAAHGLNRKGSKLDAITNIVLTDAIEIIPMTDAAARTLYE